jgi:hypothetical protein
MWQPRFDDLSFTMGRAPAWERELMQRRAQHIGGRVLYPRRCDRPHHPRISAGPNPEGNDREMRARCPVDGGHPRGDEIGIRTDVAIATTRNQKGLKTTVD